MRGGGADTENTVEEPVDPSSQPEPGPMPPLDEPAERRRRNPAPTAVALLAAVAFMLIGIGLPLVGHGSFSGADLLLAREPWKSTAPTGYSAQIASVSDTIDSVLATHHFYKEQIDSGNVPVWNPLAAGGSPLGTGISYAVFTPVNLPYLILPTWLAPAWSKLLELIVAIGGSYLFLWRLRMTRPAALIGGLLFASSGFMVTWTNWPQTQVAAFIPALFWAAERFAQLRTARSAVPIALVAGAMLLGGFPAVTGYAIYAAAPYLVLRLLQLTGRDPLRLLAALVKAGAALALGAGLVAISLLPFLSTLNQLDYLEARAQTPDIKLSPLMLLTTGVWRAYGTVTGDGYWGPSTQIEGLSFIGAGALVLIGFGVLRRPAAVIPSGVRAYFVVATALTVGARLRRRPGAGAGPEVAGLLQQPDLPDPFGARLLPGRAGRVRVRRAGPDRPPPGGGGQDAAAGVGAAAGRDRGRRLGRRGGAGRAGGPSGCSTSGRASASCRTCTGKCCGPRWPRRRCSRPGWWPPWSGAARPAAPGSPGSCTPARWR